MTQLQRWHDSTAEVRHGDLTGAIHARQMQEKRASDEAREREERAAEEAAAEAERQDLADMGRVIDISELRAQWDDADGSLG